MSEGDRERERKGNRERERENTVEEEWEASTSSPILWSLSFTARQTSLFFFPSPRHNEKKERKKEHAQKSFPLYTPCSM